MNYNRIISMQKAYNVIGIQAMINSGDAWKLEGSVSRFAMNLLEGGVCMLPKEPKRDAYGNTVPSRDMLKGDSKGTYKNCANFWNRVEDGDWDAIEYLEETFLRDEE